MTSFGDHLSARGRVADALLTERQNFVAGAHRVAQAYHQKQERQMSALVAAQSFPQRPVDDGQLAGPVVVEQIAGMRIAVEDHVLLRRKEREGNQRFDQLLAQTLPAPGERRVAAFVTLDSSLVA